MVINTFNYLEYMENPFRLHDEGKETPIFLICEFIPCHLVHF